MTADVQRVKQYDKGSGESLYLGRCRKARVCRPHGILTLQENKKGKGRSGERERKRRREKGRHTEASSYRSYASYPCAVTNERPRHEEGRVLSLARPSNLKIVLAIFQCQRRQVPRAPGVPGPMVRPGHRARRRTTNKSGRTPGETRMETRFGRDQRTRYKLKQISRIIIINLQRALIIALFLSLFRLDPILPAIT